LLSMTLFFIDIVQKPILIFIKNINRNINTKVIE
jgi:hypothetical protein